MFAQTAFAAVGCALIATGVWFVLTRPRRIWPTGRGQWVRARVIGIEPAGQTNGPPHTAWGPRVRIRYQVDGGWHEGTLRLDRTAPDDYELGQSLSVFVSSGRGGGLRTTAETNDGPSSLRLVPVAFGLVTIALGIVTLLQAR